MTTVNEGNSQVGGGGGSAITAQEDGTDLVTDAALLNFVAGLTATNPTGDEVKIVTADGEIDHDALQNYISAEHFIESSISHDGVDQTTVDSDDHHTKPTDGDGIEDISDTWRTQNVTARTSAHSAGEQDIVLADASGGTFTVTLPPATTDIDVTVKKIDSSENGVTIATPNSETIDGDSSRTITSQWVSREIVSDGSNYFIV